MHAKYVLSEFGTAVIVALERYPVVLVLVLFLLLFLPTLPGHGGLLRQFYASLTIFITECRGVVLRREQLVREQKQLHKYLQHGFWPGFMITRLVIVV